MTNTQQAIQDAIEGGWKKEAGVRFMIVNGDMFLIDETNPPFGAVACRTEALDEIEKYVLDPLFWQAIGKTRGWEEVKTPYKAGEEIYVWKWHTFIDRLADDGKSIEEALAELN